MASQALVASRPPPNDDLGVVADLCVLSWGSTEPHEIHASVCYRGDLWSPIHPPCVQLFTAGSTPLLSCGDCMFDLTDRAEDGSGQIGGMSQPARPRTVAIAATRGLPSGCEM